MKERPILFSGAMVRALLIGSKTQTRRIVKDLPPWPITAICHDAGGTGKWMPNGPSPSGTGMAAGHWRLCPYGQPGDRLWVRETFAYLGTNKRGPHAYRADTDDGERIRVDAPWKPSIHMPRAASRILLEIVSVRVERLQNISEKDARAEGATIEDRHMAGYCAGQFLPPAIRAYRDLWESISGDGSWGANPWVWVVEFKQVAP